jgi:hypothetical protein
MLGQLKQSERAELIQRQPPKPLVPIVQSAERDRHGYDQRRRQGRKQKTAERAEIHDGENAQRGRARRNRRAQQLDPPESQAAGPTAKAE